ncbi:hypothetical protein GEMMAAP_03535 [Gemmatimonas phototrophica]|uniref:BioF2-like acetyltransferase domain-containing protein n=1 Tax=Gemmatimonas phototrophica TaxID=1379270 RepID=A0A143BGI5_9BACT|nr:hypothetical protein GEMMAAP_03535 [Gemmatimonas phototrophica]
MFREVFGHETQYWTVRDADGGIVAALPITLVRSALFGRHAVSVPFLTYGGPVGSTVGQALLVERAAAQLAKEGYPSVQLRCRREGTLPYVPHFGKVLVLLPLQPAPELQMKAFPAKLRSQLRRAAKEGATAGIGLDRVDAFHAVFAEHMRDLGTPAMPRRFFAAVARTFPEETLVATVEHEGLPIAAGFGFLWRNEFEITWASSLMRYKRMAPNMMLYWTLMEYCIGAGVQIFNFGRSTPESGPHQFKRQWTDVEEPLPWYEVGNSSAVARPQKESRHFQLAARLWQKLPLPVATALGPRIVRGIP